MHILEASWNQNDRGDSVGHNRSPALCAVGTDSEDSSFLRRLHPNRREVAPASPGGTGKLAMEATSQGHRGEGGQASSEARRGLQSCPSLRPQELTHLLSASS